MQHFSNPENLSTDGPSRMPRAKSQTRIYIELFMACAIFLMLTFSLPGDLSWSLRATVGITGASIWIWVLEPIPIALTAILIIAALPILKASPLETALSGYANSSTFLVMAGFMMAQGVNSTPFGKRIANFTLVCFGGRIRGALMAILLAPQVLSIFIPTATVRIALLLPAVMAAINSMGLNRKSNTAKLLVLGLTFSTVIGSVGLIPAAIANVLTVELLRTSIGQPIYYFTWVKITWPVWLLMIPIAWVILLKVFPPEISELDFTDLRRELRELGGLTAGEKRCLAILILTVVLWMTQSIHQLPIAVPAMLAVVLMGLPGIGVVTWDQLKNIEWSTVLFLGATLSTAAAINQSGAAEFIAGKLLSVPGLQAGLSIPILSVVLLAVLTQVYHLGVSNVSTVVLTLTPIILQVASNLGINPLLAGITINLSAVFGFLLVVEALPNVVTYATDTYSAQDMFRAGFWLTLASVIVLMVTALFWWPLIGLR